MSDVLLGADLGTSGLKLVALDEDGTTVAEAERATRPDRPHPAWAETDVALWRAALEETLAAVGPRAPRPARAGAGVVRPDARRGPGGRPRRRAAAGVLWPDGRAVGELARWRELGAPDRAALANPLVPGMTGPMLAWLARHEPAVLARAAGVLLPKDALRAALVPDAPPGVTDRSDASATLLWDVPGDRWSPAAVAAAGIPPQLLPEVRPGAEVVGTTPDDVPVVVGGADTPLALLAAGSDAGLHVNVGTGVQVLRPGATPDPSMPRWCTATPTSRTAGTRWPRCRTAARPGRGSAACSACRGASCSTRRRRCRPVPKSASGPS